jgi:hypothetical protein
MANTTYEQNPRLFQANSIAPDLTNQPALPESPLSHKGAVAIRVVDLR